MKTQIRRRIHVMLAVVASVALAWILLGQQSAMTAAQTNFVGGSPSRPDSSDMRAIRLRFEAGSRSNWHSHSNWQILMAEEGRGRTQIRGEEIVELVPGRPVHAETTRRLPNQGTGTEDPQTNGPLHQRG